MGKKYVILEVDKSILRKGIFCRCFPVGAIEKDGVSEILWLHPSRIVDEGDLEGRLRAIQDMVILPSLEEAKQILLSPPAEEDEWEEWLNEYPNNKNVTTDSGRLFKWLRRMPRDKG